MKINAFLKDKKKESKFFIFLNELEWKEFVSLLAEDTLVFLMMWCQEEDIYILFLENGYRPLGIRITSSMNRYLALSPVRPAAILYERMIWELWGKEAMNAPDLRPWLDRGVWKNSWPCSVKAIPAFFPPEPYAYQENPETCQEDSDIVTVDPVSDMGNLPVSWRFSMKGNQIQNAESLYGYTHRGILSNLYGKTLLEALPVISRISAMDSVAHQTAFSHAIEDIAGLIPSLPILRKRVLLVELSRITATLFYLSRLFRLLEIEKVASRCELVRELLMRWNAHFYGHRWLMDCVFPGTVRLPAQKDDETGEKGKIPDRVLVLYSQVKQLVHAFSGLRDRLKHIGVLSLEDAVRFNIGGVIGRASARDIDFRRYMPEYSLEWLPSTPVQGGDVYARMQLWFAEIDKSFAMVDLILQEDILDEDSETDQNIIIETLHGEGIGICEGIQGDLWYYVKVEAGVIKDIFIRDPAAVQAYILQHVLKNEKMENQALIRASFGLLVTGVDL